MKNLKKKLKFNYSIQGVNVYIKTKVNIKKFLKELENAAIFPIRIRLKEEERIKAFVNAGKEHGPFWFAIYFDGN